MKTEEWSQLVCKPDASINQKAFTEQINGNEKAWLAALNFMKRDDLSELLNGRHDLTDGVYVAVSEYDAKDFDAAKYEVHRKYIDIQYVAKGEEYIEILPLNALKEEQIYDTEKDIIFFDENPQGERLYADNARFFIFFPGEVHKPGLKTGASGKIKKIIVKIPYVLPPV